MLINVLAILLIVGGRSHIQAAPIENPEQTLALIGTQETPLGNITIWGLADEPGFSVTGREPPNLIHWRQSKSGEKHERRCGSNAVSCSGSHVPVAASCAALISSLRSNGPTVLGISPRSLCLSVSGNQCCVSWANAVNGLQESDLVSAAQSIYTSCIPKANSGLARDVNLHGVCTTQCLSDRPDGCTN